MILRDIRRLLLELVGEAGQPAAKKLGNLSDPDLDRLNSMAAQHRLQPLLHSIHKGNPAIPEPTANAWREAHREAAMAALLFKAELQETCAFLEARGFKPVALKGAYLAWHAYPEPALRPLRDLDILVSREDAADARSVLNVD